MQYLIETGRLGLILTTKLRAAASWEQIEKGELYLELALVTSSWHVFVE